MEPSIALFEEECKIGGTVREALRIFPGIRQQALAFLVKNWESDVAGADIVWLMADEVERIPSGIPVLRTPIDDNANGLPDETVTGLYKWACVLRGANVCTVCHMGENRSGLASVLLMLARGVPTSRAIALAQAHPAISGGQSHTFWNPGFVAQVRRMFPE
jgi:hypothetical protein